MVYVYRNLRKNCFSVMEKGLVVDHVSSILLKNCEFVVRPAGRDRARREGRKNVHAFVKGIVIPDNGKEFPRWAMYDPYRFDSFLDIFAKEPVYEAEFVRINHKGVNYG